MEPYNYIINTAQQPNFETGFAQGQAMKQAELQRQAQAAMQADLLQLSLDPSVANISSAMAKYPQIADKFKPLLDSATEQQKQNYRRQTSDIFMMLGNGQREMAMKTLQEHADAARNAGDESAAKSAEVMKNIIESSETGDAGDKYVMSRAGLYLAAAMGPEKFLETYEGLLKMPSTVSEAEAKAQEAQASAQKAATAAKWEEAKIVSDLKEQGWRTEALQNDIRVKNANVKIAMMNAQIARESNDLKRQELALKVQDAQMERDEKVRGKVAEVNATRTDIDNMLSTVQQALDTSGLVRWGAAGPIAGYVPGAVMGSEVNDFREVLKTLKSQTKLQQLKNLKATGATMGALNESEGEALEKSFVNLSTTQSPDRLLANLKEAKRLLSKFRSNLTVKYGVPDAPVDLRPGTDPNQKTVTVEY